MTVFVSLSSTLRRLPLLALAMFATLSAQNTFANTIESATAADAPAAPLPDSPGAVLGLQHISGSSDTEHNAFAAEITGAVSRTTIAPRVKFIAYPERNQSGGQVARTWATTLGGSAVGSLVSEFGGEVIDWLRVGRHE